MNTGAQFGDEDVVVMLSEGETLTTTPASVEPPKTVGVDSIDEKTKTEGERIREETKEQTDAIMAAATNSEADAKKKVDEVVANSEGKINDLEKKAEEKKEELVHET